MLRFILFLYDFLLILAIPFYLVSLIFKGKFSLAVFERFCPLNKIIQEKIKNKKVIWVHAVSLGEVSTAKLLIKELSYRYPQDIILITTITSTGRKLAQDFSKGNIYSLSLPWDISFLIRVFIRNVNPKVLVLIETELWPNLLYYADKYNIPVLVLNARISDRSFNKYKIFSRLVVKISKQIEVFSVQSEIDHKRLLDLGIEEKKLCLGGNMKFDGLEELSVSDSNYLENLKILLKTNKDDFFIVAGSTHSGEEEPILDVFMSLKSRFSNLRLLLAPRHLERIAQVQSLVVEKGLKTEKISEVKAGGRSESVLLLDTVGSLRLVYVLADIVFIGGSLVKVGGHNILEPAFFEKAIIVGPYMHNFRAIKDLFVKNSALLQIKDKEELKDAIEMLIVDRERAQVLGRNAKALLSAQKGATAINLSLIEKYILEGHKTQSHK